MIKYTIIINGSNGLNYTWESKAENVCEMLVNTYFDHVKHNFVNGVPLDTYPEQPRFRTNDTINDSACSVIDNPTKPELKIPKEPTVTTQSGETEFQLYSPFRTRIIVERGHLSSSEKAALCITHGIPHSIKINKKTGEIFVVTDRPVKFERTDLNDTKLKYTAVVVHEQKTD